MSRYACGLALTLVALTGCLQPFARMQMGDDAEHDKDLDVRTVGDVTEVGNVGPQQVSGVGLVTGLAGTGHAPMGHYREMLEKQLRKQGAEHVKALLDSPDNALVRVTAFIPAGARRGDPIDLEVDLPPGSKAASLAGGYLHECTLREYQSTRNINPDYKVDRSLAGNIVAFGKGPLLVGCRAAEEPGELKRGHVWQGGVSLANRPIFFIMKKDDRSARIANAVAERINFMYQDDHHKARISEAHKQLLLLDDVTHKLNQSQLRGSGKIARACNTEIIEVCVPHTYRYNRQRYLLVARLVPLREEGSEASLRYRQRLRQLLLDPADSIRAALRLEALGKDSIPVLKEGLDSDDPLVRYASAEALTYLGSTAGVEELAKLARQNPMLTNFAVVALAGLDEGICRTRLAELLRCDDAPVRCAAFMALRLVAAHDPPELDGRPNRWLNGRLLNDAFWLHQVAPASTPLVTYAVDRRPEVVLYGDGISLTPPTRLLVGQDFTVTAADGDDRCTIMRISKESSQQRKQCALQLADVLATLAELGGGYPDAVDLLRKLEERGGMSCPVRVAAVPPEVTVQDIAETGRTAPPSDTQ
jgi:hypothetical protein